MTLDRITRLAYGFFGILYALIGVGSMLLPIGWLPRNMPSKFLAGEMPSPFIDHLLQEFGTLMLALGFVFLWHAPIPFRLR